MCLYLDMALKRYGHIKVLPTLENSPAFLQHLLFKKIFFLENWKKITSDPWTLQQVKGYKLEFNFCKTY